MSQEALYPHPIPGKLPLLSAKTHAEAWELARDMDKELGFSREAEPTLPADVRRAKVDAAVAGLALNMTDISFSPFSY